MLKYTFYSKSRVEHRVIHYYFTGWPDFNIVEPRQLLELIYTINKHGQRPCHSRGRTTGASTAPFVVHCRCDTKYNITISQNLFILSFVVPVLAEQVLI
jgi:protein tyrosine phosphatase